MPLKLSLKPNEKIVLNGAVVQNGDRRTTLLLQNKASVLREKDIMQLEEANTPVRRIYLPIMLMYLQGQESPDQYNEFALRMTEFMSVVRVPAILEECVNVSREVMTGEYYKALSRCRKLMDYEAERLTMEGLSMSLRAYQKAQQRVETPREIEYRLFGQVTRALMDIQDLPRHEIARRMDALDWNRRVWSFMAADCANSDNALPESLRASIISLSLWVGRYSSEVMQKGEDVEPLIDINRTIMQGLASQIERQSEAALQASEQA